MLALGSTEIAYDAPLSLGSTPLDSIWLGDQLVWPEWQPLGKYNVIINNTNDDGRLLGVNDWAIDFLDSGGQLVGGTTTGYQLPIGDTTVYSQDAFRAGSAFVRLTINNADFLIVGVNSLTYDRDVYVYTFYVTLKLAPVLTELKKAKYVSTILGQSNLCISEDGLHWHIWSGLKDIGFPDINSFTPSGIVGINYI
jgi:hypothetical protein